MIYDLYVAELHIESPFITIYQRSLLLRNGVYVSRDAFEGVRERVVGIYRRLTDGWMRNSAGLCILSGIFRRQHIKIYISVFVKPVKCCRRIFQCSPEKYWLSRGIFIVEPRLKFWMILNKISPGEFFFTKFQKVTLKHKDVAEMLLHLS